jgi:hypothetical protein
MATPRTHAFRPRGTASSLPSLIIPCPHCGGRMMAAAVKPRAVAADSSGVKDIAHGCERCGTELIRSVIAEPQPA